MPLDGTQFDPVAETYDRARPGYPDEVFDDIISLCALPPRARVLEIGCGTGQATRPMVERGFRVTAVELGENMTAIARRNLAAFPHVQIHTSRFEDWPLPDEPFDLVMSATAFHWLDQSVVYQRMADALRPRAHVAVFSSLHVLGGDEPFFEQAQRCYEQHQGPFAGGLPGRAEDIPQRFDELEASGLFEAPVFRRYEWDRIYATQGYLDVISTYTDTSDLDPASKRALFDCLSRLIDDGFGGSITKRYLTQLSVSRRAT